MNPRKVQEHQPTIWFTATGEEQRKPLIFRARQQVPAGTMEADYPMLITVHWPYEPVNEKGMPDQDVNSAQMEFEDAIAGLDVPGTSLLMLVVTGNGRKAWHWYASDVESWLDKLNELLRQYLEFPIDIENSYEPDWSLYHSFMSGVK